MKKTLLSVAVASASVLAAAQATAADVKVYGKANVSFQYSSDIDSKTSTNPENKNEQRFEVLSNASRFGLKGKADLNDDTKVIYKLEYQTAFDDGDEGKTLTSEGQDSTGTDIEVEGKAKNTIKQRNIYVGLKGDFGTIMAGMHDSPVKMIGKPVDIFSDLKYADIKNVVKGEERVKNMVMYRSPNMGGFSVDAQFAPGEEKKGLGARNQAGDSISIAAKYKLDGLSFALGSDHDVDGEDVVRFVAAYKADKFAVSGLLQSAKEHGDAPSDKKQTGVIVTASFKASSKIKLKASLGQSVATEIKNADLPTEYEKEKTVTSVVLGADYKLAKKTKIYSYVASNTTSTEDDANPAGEYADNDKYTLGIGLEHKF